MQPTQLPNIPNNTTGNQPPTLPQPITPASAPVQTPPVSTPPTGPALKKLVQTDKSPMARRAQNSSQNSLLIAELRDNFIIMNDGSMRAVITCQSINFDLMSQHEREGVEYSYQNFLNSLYFPVQILIRSQKVDIGPYLDKLAKLRNDQDNMLLGVLMDDYMDFIASIAQETNIMDKSFYVVVPYYFEADVDHTLNTTKNMLASLFSTQTQRRIHIDEASFDKAKDELRNRAQTVIAGLLQIGIRGTQLTTKELAELYYNMYNPDTAVRQPLGNYERLTGTVTTKAKGSSPQSNVGVL